MLHEVAHLTVGENRGRQLRDAAPRDEDLRRPVDPDLLDLGVIEILLKRPQTGDVGEHGARGVGPIGDRSLGAGERFLIPVGEHLID